MNGTGERGNQPHRTYRQQISLRNSFSLVGCLAGIRRYRRRAFAPILSEASIHPFADDDLSEIVDR